MTDFPTSDLRLKSCPFCSGVARWRSDHGEVHECHMIICTGCGISFDFDENPDVETVRELQVIMAAKWNNRA